MRKWLVVAAVLAAACKEKPAPDITPRVRAETERISALHASLNNADLPQEIRGEIERYKPLIESARKTEAPLYALYRLRPAFVGVESIAFVSQHRDAAADMAALEDLWKSRRVEFVKRDVEPAGPLVARALTEAGLNRGEKLYEASLTYGRITSPLYGLYYLGEAEASVKFARFVASLEFGESGEKTPSRATLAAIAETLQRDMLAGFAKDPNGRSMIGASSRMKEAREMLDAGRLAGTTLALAETRLEISRQAPRNDAPPAEVQAGGSIVDLWSAVSREHDDANTRKVIAADVLPLVASLDTAPPAARAFVPANVTVTLVRWPYT